jgi:CBS domain containing-hemolysin-like protein
MEREGISLEVLASDDRRVTQVRLAKLATESSGADNGASAADGLET